MTTDLSATLAEAKRIADGLQFACRLPDKSPDFTFCGGPAAEQFWDYFTPARVTDLVTALEKALDLHQPKPPMTVYDCNECGRIHPCPTRYHIARILSPEIATATCPVCGHGIDGRSPHPPECARCPEGYCEAPAGAWPDPLPPGFVVPKPTPFRPDEVPDA